MLKFVKHVQKTESIWIGRDKKFTKGIWCDTSTFTHVNGLKNKLKQNTLFLKQKKYSLTDNNRFWLNKHSLTCRLVLITTANALSEQI